MEKYVDLLLDRAEMLKNWREYVWRICSAVKFLLPDARIYIFGSIVKMEATVGSDIDMLIISKDIPRSNLEKARIKVKIEELAGLPPYHPFEFHIVDAQEAKWYLEKVRELREITLGYE